MSVPAKEFSRESDSDLLRAIAAGDRRALKVLYPRGATPRPVRPSARPVARWTSGASTAHWC